MTLLAAGWADVANGAALGIAVAAPIGPTALLCIQRTLDGGIVTGLATGYGAATTHAAYASVAAAGLTILTDAIAGWQSLLQLGCAAFLLRMAGRAIRYAPVLRDGILAPRLRPWRAYTTGLAWTSANPVTLLGFATLTPGILGDGGYNSERLSRVVCGVLLGSAGWWTGFAILIAAVRRRLNERGLRLANVGTGIALAMFALVVLARAY